jgi:dipeptidyl aminopeptidase/acylaminoacyl peptidase
MLYFVGHFDDGKDAKPPRDGSAQVWRIRVDGTGLTPVTQRKDGIDAFALAKDGRAVFYTVSKEEQVDQWKDLRKQFSADVQYGHGSANVSELWRLDLVTWREEKIYDTGRFVRYFDVSPETKRIAMITDPNHLLINHEGRSEVEILDLATREASELPDKLWRDDAPSPYGWLADPAWSPDGENVAFTVSYDGYPSELFIASWIRGTASVKKLARPSEAHVYGRLHWRPDDPRRICFVADHRATAPVFEVLSTDASDHRVLTPGDVVVSDFSFASDGRTIATVQSGGDYHRDIFVAKRGGPWRRLTRVNPQVDTWKLPQTSRVSWKAPDGVAVEGILELPPGYDGGERLPLIVNLHGGPTASEYIAMRYWIYGRTYFAAQGYAVLSPNYRGSTGYGDRFMIDLVGRENDVEVKDILTGVDAMIERGIADPKRLGVMGWSNGGFLTNCLIATDRFVAASSGAGVVDMTIQWGEEDTPGHVVNFLEGLPWEQPAHYQQASPLYALKPGLKTATLIHVGQNDARVPAIHSRTLHRALHYYIDAPTELIVYPGAGHSLTSYQHRLAKLKWDHAWFQKYLLGQ